MYRRAAAAGFDTAWTARTDHARVDPPVGLALPTRHLLEVTEWASSAPGTTGARRALQWYLFDITSTIEVVAVETLDEDAGSAWPMPLPAGLESGTTFTMQPSGATRWEIPGEPTHRGQFSPLRVVRPGPIAAIKGPPDLCTWQTGTGSPFEGEKIVGHQSGDRASCQRQEQHRCQAA